MGYMSGVDEFDSKINTKLNLNSNIKILLAIKNISFLSILEVYIYNNTL